MGDVSPLDVILSAMRARWRAGNIDEAVKLARLAAPFVHPRPHAAGRATRLRDMEDHEIDALCDGVGGEDAAQEAAE
ncbi:MAG: hypothetical protein ACU0B1_10495 [Thermohalobaculum sp.]